MINLADIAPVLCFKRTESENKKETMRVNASLVVVCNNIVIFNKLERFELPFSTWLNSPLLTFCFLFERY